MYFNENTPDEDIQKFGEHLASLAGTGNRFAMVAYHGWHVNGRSYQLSIMNDVAKLVESYAQAARLIHASLEAVYARMGTKALSVHAQGLGPETLKALGGMEFDFGCGHACGFAYPYGFVPEAGCPVHDNDYIELVPCRACRQTGWVRGQGMMIKCSACKGTGKRRPSAPGKK
jgi:hypothetical protein